jgi:hypothetical protein
MHLTGRPLVSTVVHGTCDMPQFTGQEEAARAGMYGGRSDIVMHPTGGCEGTNVRGTFGPATHTKQQAMGRQHMYGNSAVNADLHISRA